MEIRLLGRFDVRVDGREIPPSAWSRRQAASLVKLLALAPRRQLHREQVMDALWPDVPVDEATPRLHKAAHFARRVLGPESVALRNETVMLFPDAPVSVDTIRFQELAQDALDAGDAAAAAAAAELYGGPLLPEDRYESWAEPTRDRLQLLHLRLLRQAHRWARTGRDRSDRRRGPPRAHARPRGPRRSPGGAAPVRADGAGPARRARRAPERGGHRAAGLAARRPGRAGAGRGDDRPRGSRRRRCPLWSGCWTRRVAAAAGRCSSPARPAWASRCSRAGCAARRPAEAGGPATASPRPSRVRGPTRRCWRRSPTCAAAIRPCSTDWTTGADTTSTGRWRGRAWTGTATALSNDSLSRSPSWPDSPRPARVCC